MSAALTAPNRLFSMHKLLDNIDAIANYNIANNVSGADRLTFQTALWPVVMMHLFGDALDQAAAQLTTLAGTYPQYASILNQWASDITTYLGS